MSKFIQVSTTFSKKEDADKTADLLVKERLCSCVQIIGPINSIYRWEDKINSAGEWLCLIKSRKSLYREIEKFIKKMHPYELPEIVCTNINKGSREYLNWMMSETKKTYRNLK